MLYYICNKDRDTFKIILKKKETKGWTSKWKITKITKITKIVKLKN